VQRTISLERFVGGAKRRQQRAESESLSSALAENRRERNKSVLLLGRLLSLASCVAYCFAQPIRYIIISRASDNLSLNNLVYHIQLPVAAILPTYFLLFSANTKITCQDRAKRGIGQVDCFVRYYLIQLYFIKTSLQGPGLPGPLLYNF